MTQQHFLRMAEEIRKDVDYANQFMSSLTMLEYKEMIGKARHVAKVFTVVAKDFNPKFDESRFYRACGLKQ